MKRLPITTKSSWLIANGPNDKYDNRIAVVSCWFASKMNRLENLQINYE
jgi:hypothetical protein